MADSSTEQELYQMFLNHHVAPESKSAKRSKQNNFQNRHNDGGAAMSLQLCPTLCDPIDGSPPGSRVPGILQARTLEWVAISLSNA